MKKIAIVILFIAAVSILSACTYIETGQIQNVGLLVDTSIDENAWNKKGYEGLLKIEEEFDVQVYYEENIDTKEEINNAVAEFVQDGVNLIYGHSNMYGSYFLEIAELYPDVQFVYFNGGKPAENVTSLNFDSHAMGFLSGVVAGEMTSSNQVGIIGAYSWQPEIEGFYEGVKYQNPAAEIDMSFITDWDDTETVATVYEDMEQAGVDVFYPIGDFSEEVIKMAEKDGLYAIGYISDQMEVAPNTVLTSTIQHVDKLYESTAKLYNDYNLEGALLSFDFQDEVISLGEFNDRLPKAFQEEMTNHVKDYIETGLLPNEE
ncbi:BMP family ABC transporter substrate-binding protein [Oceanobacillus rekensis]|uniref:BMP family ABC transporter substrate-binding protein n=1 Tax=Oceanobacillus rekensis TaxID=937927 RepID=UPI000B443EA4|nr:BMP family ABC transporter substrate-binding protein [Oceanobacillus rekensis]